MAKLSKRDQGLRLEVFADAAQLSRHAARLIVSRLRANPDLLLCASAGGTPTGTYEHLGMIARKKPGLFRKMRVVQIDEWGGLPSDHPASCATDLRRKLLEPLQIPNRRFVGFDSSASDSVAECERISQWLAVHGPIDICILGLGLNGHIAMNEPGPMLWPNVHRARLTESSKNHPMLKELKRRPSYGFTLGMGDILRSREILLLVSGSHKRPIMKRLLRPQVTTALPASMLMLHGNTHLVCDRAAVEGT